MMRRLLLLLLGVVGLIAADVQFARAHYYGHGLGEPITQGLLQISPDGTITLTKNIWKEVQEQHTRNVPVEETVEENGKTVVKKKVVPEKYTTTRRVSAAVNMVISEEELQLFDIAGKEVTLASARSRLSRPTLVLMTEDGKLHASFAGLFKKDALVLAYSSRPVAQPPHAVPAPAPPQGAPVPPPAATLQPRGQSLSVQFVSQQTKQGNVEKTEEYKSPFPLGAAPTFRYCQLQDKGTTVAVRHFFESKMTTTAMKTVDKGGVKEMVPFQLVKTIGSDETTLWDRKMVKFLTIAGKPLDAAKVSAMSDRETAVIASGDNQPVDKFWLQNVNPDAPVIVLQEVSYGYGQPPVPNVVPTAPPPPPGAAPPASKAG